MTTRRQKVIDELKRQIDEGVLLADERLPSITALCESYGVSDITVRAALRELEKNGYVEARRGSGVFVRKQREEQNLPSLSGNKVIALLVPHWGDLFFSRIVSGAEREAGRRGYRLIIANSRGNPQIEAEEIQSLASQVAGLLIVPLDVRSYASYVSLLERGVPFVFIDRYVEKLSVPVVATDNERGGYMAAKHLIERGYKSVFVLSEGNGEATSLRDRLEGCRRAFKEAGVGFNQRNVRISSHVMETAGYSLAKQVLEEQEALNNNEHFAFFALNDGIARGACIAIREAGLQIPGDVAVVGFDDVDAAFFEPPLSSVRQPMVEIGEAAARILIEMLTPGVRKKTRSLLLPPQLQVRNSSDASSDFHLSRYISGAAENIQRDPTALEAAS